jgi:hypothetical protein
MGPGGGHEGRNHWQELVNVGTQPITKGGGGENSPPRGVTDQSAEKISYRKRIVTRKVTERESYRTRMIPNTRLSQYPDIGPDW